MHKNQLLIGWASRDVSTDKPVGVHGQFHFHTTGDIAGMAKAGQDFPCAMELMPTAEYQEFFVVTVAAAIIEAWRSRQPGAVAWGYGYAVIGRSRRIIERYREQDTYPGISMNLHVVKMGEIAFAFNPFELYMDYMHRIKARSPFEQTFVVQLTGDESAMSYGYLATERGAWGGGYSASLYCNQVSPAGGQELVEATLELLNKK